MDFMARYGARLVDSGFHILPLAPGQKRPAYFELGEWKMMYGWGQYAVRQPSSLELQYWCRWPGAGVGVPGGKVVGIDIDVLDADLAIEVDRLCQRELGDTPALRIGQAPKRLLVYRTAEPFSSRSYGSLEILCLGRQFVAYGIHPVTGCAYEWPEEGLADLDLQDLPVATEHAVAAFVQRVLKVLPVPEHYAVEVAQARPRSVATPTTGRPNASRLGTPEGVRSALWFYGNPDRPRYQWVQIGMALKGGLKEEEGWSLFDAWSRLSTKYDPGVTLKTWWSMKPHSIGAGTIYHLAFAAGWRPDSEMQLNGDFQNMKRRIQKLQLT